MHRRRQCGAAACTKSENGKLKFHSLNLLRAGIGGQMSTDSGQIQSRCVYSWNWKTWEMKGLNPRMLIFIIVISPY